MNDTKSTTEPSAAARRVGVALVHFGRSMEAMRNYAAKQLGLHSSDLSCLGFMHSAGKPVSPKQIIAHLEMSSGTGTALLDRLEAVGYIRRVPNPEDRRSVLIVLDEVKAERPLSFYKMVRANYERVLSERSEEELEHFASMLAEFASMDFTDQLKDLAV